MYKSKIIGLMIIIAITQLALISIITVQTETTSTIMTDKADYTSGETVNISGAGFDADSYYDIPVIRPDCRIVVGDGSFVEGWDTVNTDDSCSFTYEYILDGIEGVYEVRVYNSPWSGDLSEIPLATTTFTDGPVGNLLKAHEIWDPAPSVLDWEPGHPKGYSEAEIAAFRVTVGSASSPVTPSETYDFYILLDLDASASGYAFTDIESWDTTYQQDGTHLSPPPFVADLTGDVDGVNAAGANIDSVTFDGHIDSGSNKGYQVWHVTFTTLADVGDVVYVVYGGHIAAAGDSIKSGGIVPSGKGASAIKGTFQAKVDSTGIGAKTVNFAGPEVIPFDAAVSGYKWEDANGDGIKDAGELYLDGWTIELWNADGSEMLASASTGDGDWPDGYYRFTDLPAETYRVYEDTQSGWTQTYPSAPAYHTITVAAGEDSQNNNFGNFENVDVSACKVLDADGNPRTTDDWTRVEGWNVYLTLDGERIRPMGVTGADGCYTWENLGPGNYGVEEDDPSPEYTALIPVTWSFGPVSSGGSYSHTFINFENVDVRACKVEDADGGLGTTGDQTRVSGWTVYLYKDRVLVDTQVTGDGGCYTWENLGPGSYAVVEEVRSDWTALTPKAHNFGPVSSGGFYSYTFANFKLGKKGGYKYFDVNYNGQWDEGEPPIQGWTINLKDSGGNIIASATTDADGWYLFDGLMAGDYMVQEDLPCGWECIEPGPGASYSFTVTSGFDESDNNFGNYYGTSRVTDTSYCYFDKDSGVDGQQFKLIFHPDVPDNPAQYRLTSSNPGQFYYNTFYVGSLTIGSTFTVTLPYPFVTQGAMPVHVYASIGVDGSCLVPLDDITYMFHTNPVEPAPEGLITLDSYGIEDFGNTVEIEVISDVDYSGFLYITVHVDYGLKKTGGYDNIDGSAVNSVEIENYGDYEFSFAIDGNSLDTQTIQNMNLFKHDPGFMGIVSDEMGNPLEGRTVRIYGPDDELLATLNTDEDGFYSFYYKHKGRQAYYTIEVETMGGLKLSQQGLLKSNKFAVVNFEI